MRSNPYVNEILGAEYYHEIEGYDCRIAVRKLQDVYLTLGDASEALTYANKVEYKEINFETQLMQRTHLRHAIIDLNNCFDLLLQVPWFFYRIGLSLCPEIERNTENWVRRLEEKCRINPVIDKLVNATNPKKNVVGKALKDFLEVYIFNDKKPFTVRSLTNYLKHNGVLKLKEFESPLTFNVNVNGIDKLDTNLVKIELCTRFYGQENPEVDLGIIKITSSEHAVADIIFNKGEYFRGIDYSYVEDSISIDSAFTEVEGYHDAFIVLLGVIHENIYSEIPLSPCFDATKTKVKTKTINLDNWYKK